MHNNLHFQLPTGYTHWVITGNIASGKSTVTPFFQKKGYTVINFDQVIHDLYKQPEIISWIQSMFPETISQQGFKKSSLSKIVFQSTSSLQILESYLYPKLNQHVTQLFKNHPQAYVLEVPLFFEKQVRLEGRYKVLLCVASYKVRKNRFYQRLQHTQSSKEPIPLKQSDENELFQRIDSQFMSHTIKSKQVDYVCNTERSLWKVSKDVKEWIDESKH